MDKQEQIKEIESLNLDEMDVEELEERMELAAAGSTATGCLLLLCVTDYR